jgi:predicted GNAT family acetyltransferase
MLMRNVLAAAAAEGQAVSIHVEIFNPAMRLYERLGFRQIDTYGVYHLMEWRPASVEDGLVEKAR